MSLPASTTTLATPTIVAARLDDLIVARVATSAHALDPAAFARGLAAFAPKAWDERRWQAAIAEATERLRAAGELERDGHVDGGAAIAKRFGLGASTSWQRLVEKVIPALALGIAIDDARTLVRLKDRDAWAAAIVGRALGIWQDGPPPSAAATCDALVWRGLRLAGKAKRTPPEIRALFVNQVLGTTEGAFDRQLRLLAAREADARRPDLRGLREALGRRWLVGASWSADESPVTEASARSGPTSAELAALVREAAARATSGVFGERKVFIAAIWHALREHPAIAGMSLEAFKAALLAAHKAGMIALVRADLVAAMDPRLVAESEISHLEARYHFVEREGGT